MKIRRKFCSLHGWAPHRIHYWQDMLDFEKLVTCCRCRPAYELTKTAKILGFMRGFKLPRKVKARDFVGSRFND